MEASTVPQMPPNGVLSHLRSFEDYCSFWKAYRSFQMLVIVYDGSITFGDRFFEYFAPPRISVKACGGFHLSPQMPRIGVLSRLRSFEGYCNVWEAYRSSQMLAIVNDSRPHWRTGSLSILHRLALVWKACAGFHRSPNAPQTEFKAV